MLSVTVLFTARAVGKMKLRTFLLIFCLFLGCYATKLNYPRILLPIFDTISMNFTLEVVEKGCYTW